MKRAFSLIEVLVAVALVAGLAVAMSGFIWGVRARRETLATDAARMQGIAALFMHVENDVLTCVAGEAGKAGVRGGPEQLSLLTRGVGLVWGGDGPDLGDIQGVEYTFAGSSVTAKRWRGASREGDLGEDTIIEGVGLVRFRYFDQGRWVSSFDSVSAGRLPAAIEIAIWFVPPPDLETLIDEADAPANLADETSPVPGGGSLEAPGGASDRPANPDRVRVISVPDGPDAWGAR